MQRVGLYMRVSTTDQTTDNQRIELRRVAAQRGWTIVGEYIDHGVSGSKGRDKRPSFDRLAKDAAQGKLDMVAAWSIDRLGRNLGHLVQFTDELRQQNVGLYLHQQQVDTSTAAGRAFLHMAGVFAEFERSVIVERIHAGLARARAQGKHMGRPSTLTPATQDQIRRLAAEGMGKVKIGRTLRCGTATVQRVLAT